jgi:hypothetical protein
MQTVKLVAVFEENKQGQLARLTRTLAEARINIRWIAIATLSQIGVVKILVDQVDAATQALRQNGFTVSSLEVLAVEVPDQAGALNTVTECLARHNINVENASGFVTNPHKRAVLLLETKSLEEAEQALRKQGLRLYTQAEVLAI